MQRSECGVHAERVNDTVLILPCRKDYSLIEKREQFADDIADLKADVRYGSTSLIRAYRNAARIDDIYKVAQLRRSEAKTGDPR